MANPEGIDVSGHQGIVNWDAVKGAGIVFAFIKAAEGTGFVDPQWARNIGEARRVGVIPGAYFYYHYNLDPTAQANHFLHVMGALHAGDMPPTVDVEAPTDGSGASQGVSANIARLQTFLDVVETATRHKPIIYTYPSVWQTTMGNTSHFVGYPLWIANYGVSHPTVPGGWPGYKFWQYTDQGSVPGALHVDRDVFNGTLSELQAFAGGTPPPPPPNQTAIEAYATSHPYVGLAVEPNERSMMLEDGLVYQVRFYERALLHWRSEKGVGEARVGAMLLNELVKHGEI